MFLARKALKPVVKITDLLSTFIPLKIAERSQVKSFFDAKLSFVHLASFRSAILNKMVT
jgi:hypothetical protein